jgi:hypothetical protein
MIVVLLMIPTGGCPWHLPLLQSFGLIHCVAVSRSTTLLEQRLLWCSYPCYSALTWCAALPRQTCAAAKAPDTSPLCTPPSSTGAGYHGTHSIYAHAAQSLLRFLAGSWQALQNGYSSQWELPEHVPAPATTAQLPGLYMGYDPEEDVQQRFVETFDTLLRFSTSSRMSGLLQTLPPSLGWGAHGGEVLACVAVVGRELGRCAGGIWRCAVAYVAGSGACSVACCVWLTQTAVVLLEPGRALYVATASALVPQRGRAGVTCWACWASSPACKAWQLHNMNGMANAVSGCTCTAGHPPCTAGHLTCTACHPP